MTNPARRSEGGSTLVGAILFAIVILALTSSVLVSGHALLSQKRSLVATHRASGAAESGIHIVVAKIRDDLDNLLLNGGTFTGSLQGAGEGAQRYRVVAMPAAADGVDNDIDGFVDEEDEADTLELESIGSFDRIAKTVRVTLKPRFRVPLLTGAVYIGDPNAVIDLDGNALKVSGEEVDLTGAPTGGMGVGIGVGGDPTWVESQIPAAILADNVIGAPKVGQVVPHDTRYLAEDAARTASVVLESGATSKPEKKGDWGTLAAPAIVYGTGDIKISGGAEGAGLLVVDGDLEISGRFEWAGIVLVRGAVTLTGGGNGKRIIGGLIVEQEFRATGDTELGGKGTIDVLYSPDALTLLQSRFLTTYMLVNWREGPNPVEK